MKSDPVSYCDLELISEEEWNAAQAKPALKTWLQTLGDFMLSILANNNEPKIWTTCDRLGIQHWHLYDLSIRQTFTFDSEYEVLAWFDNRCSR